MIGLANLYLQNILDAGFVHSGQEGRKQVLIRGKEKILFCAPCRHIVYKGVIIKFGTIECGKFLKDILK